LGEFGERLQKEYKRFVPKHPLSGALITSGAWDTRPEPITL
jgi:hypothetical protein